MATPSYPDTLAGQMDLGADGSATFSPPASTGWEVHGFEADGGKARFEVKRDVDDDGTAEFGPREVAEVEDGDGYEGRLIEVGPDDEIVATDLSGSAGTDVAITGREVS